MNAAEGVAGSTRPGSSAIQTKRRWLIGLALVSLGLTMSVGPTPRLGLSPGSAPTPAPSPGNAYGKLPLAFVPNAGQTETRVRYSARAAGVSFYFTRKEAVFSLTRGRAAKGVVLRLAFLGASPAASIEGRRPGVGRVNYLIGTDPAKWHTNLPTYGEIVYRDLWPGIDLAFRGEKGKLKYEFRVAPGGSVRDIRLAYGGASGLRLDRSGNLAIRTPLGSLEDSRPISYQQVGGRRVPVESRYLLDRDGSRYGFAVGPYDRRLPLVIDPGLAYATYLGGVDGDVGHGIAVDAAGSAYVTGFTFSADFPTTPGAFDTTFHGSTDVFVTKLDPTGSVAVYSTYLGGSGFDAGRAIAVDSAGSAYVTGRPSAGFATTAGAFDTTLDGGGDAFVTKLDPSGSALVYSTYLGGSSFDEGHGIAVDAAGDAYVTGFAGSDFPTTPGAFDTTFNGVSDPFVAKLNPAGSGLVYSTYLGGSDHEAQFGGIAIDGTGSAYVTGDTASSNFPTTAGAFDTALDGSGDAFVTKLNPTGSGLAYSTYLGGTGVDEGHGIGVDAAGNAYVTGAPSTGFPTTGGAFDTTLDGGSDSFVTKLNTTGSALAYSTFLGGSGPDGPQFGAIAADAAGSAYVTGFTSSSDFPTTPGAFDTTLFGGTDAFLTKLNLTGSALAYSTYLGGSGTDFGRAIAIDAAGSAYLTGLASFDFPVTPGAFDTTANGTGDAFAAKLETIAVLVPATLVLTPAADTNPVGASHTVTATVKDAIAQPVPGVIVRFTVTGSVSASGQCTTGSNGQCTFTYLGPTLPGQDAITAYADSDGDDTQDVGEPSGAATKTWVLPPSTPSCDVSDGGRITAANGDKATFGGHATVTASGHPDGQQTFQDHGPARRITVKSTNVLAVVCSADGKQADIFGQATIEGSGSFDYRIRVNDNGEPGRGVDNYWILLSSGYSSGLQRLEAGNVQITLHA